MPAPRPRPSWVLTSSAAAATSGTEAGATIPAERAKKPGSSSWPIATTGTPRVSRYSSVAGTSRIAFGPAQTTAIGRSGELLEVGRDVERWFRRSGMRSWPQVAERTAMDAADPAGREDGDPGGVGRDHRRRDRRRGPAAGGEGRRQARSSRLPNRARRGGRQCLERAGVKPDQDSAFVDGNRGWHGSGRTHSGLRGCGDLEVLRIGQTMADQGRFEGDDRSARGECGGDGRRDDQSSCDIEWNTHIASLAPALPCRSCQLVGP